MSSASRVGARSWADGIDLPPKQARASEGPRVMQPAPGERDDVVLRFRRTRLGAGRLEEILRARGL